MPRPPLRPPEPEILDAEALLELDPEALFAEALDEEVTGRTAAIHPDEPLDPGEPLDPSALLELEPEPIPLDLSALEELDPLPLPEEEQIPLVEGFIGTALDTGVDRRASKRSRDGDRRAANAPVAFSYAACPACNTPQPQPAPAFCEACGTRLARPKKGASDAEAALRRCGECGFKTGGGASNCGNCGSRLPDGG